MRLPLEGIKVIDFTQVPRVRSYWLGSAPTC
jgi:hypothetical protein